MNSKVIKNMILTIILYICCSLFMNGFYKSLSGFIANNFNDPLLMVTMLISYILPVLCFLVYFYNYYVKPLNKVTNAIYSSLVIILSITSLVLIANNIEIYANNNILGVYDSIPSIIVKFPYDSIIVDVALLIASIYNISLIIKPKHKYAFVKENMYSLGYIKLNVLEYILICILAILALFTVGDFICGLNSLANILYDGKYLFLLLWVLIIPTMNLLSYVFKVETRNINKKNKVIYLSSLIIINILFASLLLVFESITPSFIVAIGKPLFPIAFSISFPVEMIVLLAIQVISILIDTVKLIVCITNKA